MRFRKMLLTLPLTAGLVAGGQGVASAAPGQVSLCATGGMNFLVDIAPGGAAWTGINGCIGEGTRYFPYTEPHSFLIKRGTCARFAINSGPWSENICAYTDRWQNIFPGEGLDKNWRVYVASQPLLTGTD